MELPSLGMLPTAKDPNLAMRHGYSQPDANPVIIIIAIITVIIIIIFSISSQFPKMQSFASLQHYLLSVTFQSTYQILLWHF